MSRLTIDIGEIPRLFAEVSQQLSSMTFEEPLAEIADDLRILHAGYFDSEAGPSGEAWLPWYFRSEDAPKSHPTLFVTGRLRQSMIDGPDHIETVGPNMLTFGTDVPYAAIHNFGATITTGIPLIGRGGNYLPAGSRLTIPQREFIGMNDESVDHAGDVILVFATDQLRG
jgi:phage gpG-like protein